MFPAHNLQKKKFLWAPTPPHTRSGFSEHEKCFFRTPRKCVHFSDDMEPTHRRANLSSHARKGELLLEEHRKEVLARHEEERLANESERLINVGDRWSHINEDAGYGDRMFMQLNRGGGIISASTGTRLF